MTVYDEKLTRLLYYIYGAEDRHRVVYGIHVDEQECAPLFARNLIEKRHTTWGETHIVLSPRGANLVRAHRSVEPADTAGVAW